MSTLAPATIVDIKLNVLRDSIDVLDQAVKPERRTFSDAEREWTKAKTLAAEAEADFSRAARKYDEAKFDNDDNRGNLYLQCVRAYEALLAARCDAAVALVKSKNAERVVEVFEKRIADVKEEIAQLEPLL